MYIASVAQLDRASDYGSEGLGVRIPPGALMKIYTYYDNKKGGIEIFTCTALNILDADKLYQTETGFNCVAQAHIGCRVTQLA